ncbi:MAG: hypothetical protein WBA23_20610 [Tunicatimonas sp.]|uniref:hypothetical protein n=1 Tax=Tunicatimonas sp. TaxID=1940096 RepID=UPI003C78285A
MKKSLIILLLLADHVVQPQRLEEKTIAWQADQEVLLDLKYAQDIQIKTWDKPEVALRISVSVNNDALNDAWSLKITTTEDRIEVTSDLKKPKKYYRGDCEGSSYQMGENSFCSLIVYDIYLPKEASLRIETLGGNITITGVTAPVYAKSLSGFVDTNWPAQQGASVSMKSITGEVYTNFDLTIDELDKRENRRSPVGWEIEAAVAGGGSKVELESISNNVYFRKSGL